MAFDVEVKAVARVFADPLLARKNQEADGRFWDGRSLDPVELLQAASRWSSSERALAQLAAELWGYSFAPDEPRISLIDACDGMEQRVLVCVLEAVALRAGLMTPEHKLGLSVREATAAVD